MVTMVCPDDELVVHQLAGVRLKGGREAACGEGYGPLLPARSIREKIFVRVP